MADVDQLAVLTGDVIDRDEVREAGELPEQCERRKCDCR